MAKATKPTTKSAHARQASVVMAALAGPTAQVKITGANGIKYQGNVRPVGQPLPTARTPGPNWKFALPAGSYLFNVNIAAVAGVTVTFAFAGGTPTSPTSFAMAGPNGTVVGLNAQISFDVP